MSPRHSVYFLCFLLGAYAVCAQATLLRETQVVLFGSELSWGLVLAFWLAGVAIGAKLGGWVLGLSRRRWIVLAISSLAMPLLLVVSVSFIRASRSLLGSGPGEYLGFKSLGLVAAAATMPVSFWIGLAFPAASTLLSDDRTESNHKARSIGSAYLTESAGSLIGGALYSFLLVSLLDAYSLIVGGGVLLAYCAYCLVRLQSPPDRWMSTGILVWALALTVVIITGGTATMERSTVLNRWASFAPGLELVTSANSRYQNIEIGRLDGQLSLYTNGTVAATWPDHSTLAIEAHTAACQHPNPRRMLVVGGGVEGLLKELLKHDPESLDYVTLDRMEHDMVARYLGESDKAALEDARTRVHLEDARRFVKHSAEADHSRFDLVILAAPQPASTLLARLYTAEFFAELSGIMAADGVLSLTLAGSAGAWGPEVSSYVGSIVTPLERAFAEVLLTFGDPVRIFAAKRADVVTGNGALLAERYSARQVDSPFFSPLWFEGASDFLDLEKRALVRNSLATQQPLHFNRDAQPVAALYYLRLWLASSGSAHAGGTDPVESSSDLVSPILEVKLRWVFAAILTCLAVGLLVSLKRGKKGLRHAALFWSVGTTGFTAMAIEIVLLYALQVLFGYVYGLIGLAIGVFMFGLVVGCAVMNRNVGGRAWRFSLRRSFYIVLGLDLTLVLFAAVLPAALRTLGTSADQIVTQTILFSMIGLTGIIGGMLIPIAAFIRLHTDSDVARSAAAVDAADHIGAGLGALVTGVVLMPVLGIAGTCLVIALTKVLSAAVVASVATRGLEPA